ncbi:MAG: acyl carrier protein [Phycisphaerales bacterium]|nr:acyl carrier protein [Phycisphaerales bacterium]
MNASPQDKLREIVATVLEIDMTNVRGSMSRTQTKQWDSLNHLNICVAVGQEFQVEISAEEMTRIQRVADLARLLAARGVKIDPDFGEEAE